MTDNRQAQGEGIVWSEWYDYHPSGVTDRLAPIRHRPNSIAPGQFIEEHVDADYLNALEARAAAGDAAVQERELAKADLREAETWARVAKGERDEARIVAEQMQAAAEALVTRAEAAERQLQEAQETIVSLSRAVDSEGYVGGHAIESLELHKRREADLRQALENLQRNGRQVEALLPPRGSEVPAGPCFWFRESLRDAQRALDAMAAQQPSAPEAS